MPWVAAVRRVLTPVGSLHSAGRARAELGAAWQGGEEGTPPHQQVQVFRHLERQPPCLGWGRLLAGVATQKG